MKYCKKCLIPSTKPHITFNRSGICAACETSATKQAGGHGIDWDIRTKKFHTLVLEAKAKHAPLFDAMVPVSGGKDSITQVHRLKGFDLRILAINVDYGIKTEIGKKNLQCIPRMGAHLMTLQPEEKLHKKLIRMGLEDFGDPDLLSHTLLHAWPLHIAIGLKIPLAVLGENSAFEYGGETSIAENYFMTREWFSKFAANNGRDAKFISKLYDIPYPLLKLYDYPDALDSSKTQAVFSSHFFNWDSETHLAIAKQYGFNELEAPREGTYRTYVGIDEKINRIHQYLKVLKFGYGRATDHACEDIRCGRITREEGKKLVAEYDLQELSDDYINDFCQFTAYTRNEFLDILEKYRNKDIWKKDSQGNWYIPGHLVDET